MEFLSNYLLDSQDHVKRYLFVSVCFCLFNCTANIFNVIFTVFKYVPISTVISLYGLHFIAAPSTVE